MAGDDPVYMGFLPALGPAMVAAWHQPKVSWHSFEGVFLLTSQRI